MKKLAIIFLIFSCSSCNAGEKTTDQAQFEQHTFKLLTDSNGCLLIHKTTSLSKNIKLGLSPPCHFMRKSNDTLLHYAYKDKGVIATLVIVGNPISDATRKEWNLNEQLVCGEKAQGVLIYNNKVVLSDKLLEGGVMCPAKGLDEKDFWYLAH